MNEYYQGFRLIGFEQLRHEIWVAQHSGNNPFQQVGVEQFDDEDEGRFFLMTFETNKGLVAVREQQECYYTRAAALELFGRALDKNACKQPTRWPL